MLITITGETPSKKNSRNLFVKNGRMMNLPSKRYAEWEKDALLQLQSQFKGCAEGKVTIAYTFYVGTLRRKDVDNMIASVNDVLVKAGLIIDDDWQHLAIGAGDAELDRDNPRAELFIEED